MNEAPRSGRTACSDCDLRCTSVRLSVNSLYRRSWRRLRRTPRSPWQTTSLSWRMSRRDTLNRKQSFKQRLTLFGYCWMLFTYPKIPRLADSAGRRNWETRCSATAAGAFLVRLLPNTYAHTGLKVLQAETSCTAAGLAADLALTNERLCMAEAAREAAEKRCEELMRVGLRWCWSIFAFLWMDGRVIKSIRFINNCFSSS